MPIPEIIEAILEKHEIFCKQKNQPYYFMDFLLDLDAQQWCELIFDIVLYFNSVPRKGWSSHILPYTREDTAAYYYEQFFKQLMPSNKFLICAAMNAVFVKAMNVITDNHIRRKILLGLFGLTSALQGGLSSDMIISVIENKKQTRDIRREAARALESVAGFAESIPMSFWENIKEKFLIPRAFSALASYSPSMALKKLAQLGSLPKEEKTLRLLIGVSMFIIYEFEKKCQIGELKELICKQPIWIKKFIKNLHAYKRAASKK